MLSRIYNLASDLESPPPNPRITASFPGLLPFRNCLRSNNSFDKPVFRSPGVLESQAGVGPQGWFCSAGDRTCQALNQGRQAA
jgi:hypothetical protein